MYYGHITKMEQHKTLFMYYNEMNISKIVVALDPNDLRQNLLSLTDKQ